MEIKKEKFISVINDNQGLIYKISACYCPEPEDRKDLQQDILIQLWNSFDHYNGKSKISTWFYRIALNTAISFYRKGRKHTEKRISINESILSEHEDKSETDNNENLKLLYQAINSLNEFDKALILLHLDGNKYADIAEIMGINESNVATKIYRIKQLIKNQIMNL